MKAPNRHSCWMVIIAAMLVSLCVGSCGYGSMDDRIVWQFKAPRDLMWPGPGSATTPRIVGGRVVYTGGYDLRNSVYLFVVDSRTGKLIWKTEEPVEAFDVDGDYVFTTSRDPVYNKIPGKERKIYIRCYGIADGKRRWQIETETRRFEMQMLPIGERLYCWLPGQDLFAVDKSNGRICWHVKEANTPIQIGRAYVVTRGDIICVMVPRERVFIFDGAREKAIGAISLAQMSGGGLQSADVFDDRLFLVDTSGILTVADLAIKKVTGIVRVGNIETDIATDGDSLYYGLAEPSGSTASGRDRPPESDANNEAKTETDRKEEAEKVGADEKAATVTRDAGISNERKEKSRAAKARSKKRRKKKKHKHSLCRFDLSEGKVLWQHQVFSSIVGKPLVEKDMIVVATASKDNRLYAIDRRSGKEQWSVECGAMKSIPAISDGIVYVNGSENLFAVKVETGEVVFTVKPEEYSPIATPVVKDGIVYMVGQDSNLYAIRAAHSGGKKSVKAGDQH